MMGSFPVCQGKSFSPLPSNSEPTKFRRAQSTDTRYEDPKIKRDETNRYNSISPTARQNINALIKCKPTQNEAADGNMSLSLNVALSYQAWVPCTQVPCTLPCKVQPSAYLVRGATNSKYRYPHTETPHLPSTNINILHHCIYGSN